MNPPQVFSCPASVSWRTEPYMLGKLPSWRTLPFISQGNFQYSHYFKVTQTLLRKGFNETWVLTQFCISFLPNLGYKPDWSLVSVVWNQVKFGTVFEWFTVWNCKSRLFIFVITLVPLFPNRLLLPTPILELTGYIFYRMFTLQNMFTERTWDY